MLLDWFIRRRLAAFERRHGYDASYAYRLLAASRRGFFGFARAGALANFRDDVPLDAWHAAKIAAVRAEDCGPCTQLAVDMAHDAGVDAAVLSAVLRDDVVALPDPVARAVRYAKAAVGRTADLPAAIEEVTWAWGERGLASLALTISGARLYPIVKAALGAGQACERVRVGTEVVDMATMAHAR
jgi:hypothetical protein